MPLLQALKRQRERERAPRTVDDFSDLNPEYVERLEARVEKGMAFLDEHRPSWDIRMADKLGRLDMQDPYSCVVGHTFGDYHEVFGYDRPGSPFGFAKDKGEPGETWSTLNRMWSYKIEQRLGTL